MLMRATLAAISAAVFCSAGQAQTMNSGNAISNAAANVAQSVDPLPRARPEEVGMSSERLVEIAKVINADVEKGRLPGAVIAIARRGRLVYYEALGFRDKSAGVAMTKDTIFNIASMTKPMVALAALQLHERGQLLIDDPLTQYFPQFADRQVAQLDASGETITGKVPAKQPITLRHLLMHTSGMIYGGRGSTAVHKLYPSGSGAAAETMTASEFMDKLASLPLLNQPGETWDYGFGLDVLAQVIEKVSGKPIAKYFEENIWKPLGMTDTGFFIPPDKAARYAKTLPLDPDTGKPQAASPNLTQPLRFECGGGCLSSTAADYLRFAQMLLNKGAFGEARILGRKTAEYMVTNQLGPEVKNLIANTDPTKADYGFGLGLAVRTEAGRGRVMGSVGDFSWPGASGTNWWADPKEQLVVVFMAHSPGPIRWHYRQVINALVYQALVD
ncbi:MAG TPA: serine hydrolase domain-containing protein [Xanthobacteraceae bacterium]|nr:serine hydrolase domain-containing protein [Xanthobacteraceae bacterium]